MKTTKITKLALIATATSAAAIALPATAHASVDFDFHSPSGNIFCDMHTGDDGKSQTTCITTDHSWVSPPRSPDCSAD